MSGRGGTKRHGYFSCFSFERDFLYSFWKLYNVLPQAFLGIRSGKCDDDFVFPEVVYG